VVVVVRMLIRRERTARRQCRHGQRPAQPYQTATAGVDTFNSVLCGLRHGGFLQYLIDKILPARPVGAQ
jgi:hypothetical protein